LVIGTKIRRLGGTSTTNPVNLGGLSPMRRTTTASRTFPT